MNAQNPFPLDPVEVHPVDAPRPVDACPADARPGDVRRQRARHTALWVAAIAALFYLGFIALVGLTQ